MKKNLSIFSLAIFSSLFFQNIAFDKLSGNSEFVHFYLGHYSVSDIDGLDINWDGSIKFQASEWVGIQLSNSDNVGIGKNDP